MRALLGEEGGSQRVILLVGRRWVYLAVRLFGTYRRLSFGVVRSLTERS